MTWLRGRPKGRVWALVLWDHSYQPVSNAPAVMQFEPRRDEWISRDFHYPSSQCSYSPLPYHERFDAETHLFHPPPVAEEHVPERCRKRLGSHAFCSLYYGHAGACQSWKPQE